MFLCYSILLLLYLSYSICDMVRILDSKSEIGALVRGNFCNLICIRHFIKSRAVSNRIFFIRKELFSFMGAQHVLSYHINQNHEKDLISFIQKDHGCFYKMVTQK